MSAIEVEYDLPTVPQTLVLKITEDDWEVDIE